MGQGTGAAVPPAQYSPGAQGAHVGGALPEPGAVWRVPAAHALAGKHWLELGVIEYVLGGQSMQTWSADALPG